MSRGGFLRNAQINAQIKRDIRAKKRAAKRAQRPQRSIGTQPGLFDDGPEMYGANPYEAAEYGPQFQNYYSYVYPEGFYGEEVATTVYEEYGYEGTQRETNQWINIPGRPPVGP